MRSFTRRGFLQMMGLGAASVAMPGCLSASQRSSGRGKQPNIILMMSDDMGFSDIGCYGSEIDTPVLDKLAAKGLRFTQFYNTARCCPTRASLMTGVYQHQAGIGHMTGDYGWESYRGNLSKNCVTIAEALKGAGYGTYMAGKWHVTLPDIRARTGLRIIGRGSAGSTGSTGRLRGRAASTTRRLFAGTIRISRR